MRGATIQNGKALYLRTIQRALNRMALIPQSKLVWRTRVAFIVLAMPMFCRAQVITTVAGVNNLGYAGDGGPAVSASLSNPEGLVLDSAGNLYFADKGNYAVREVNSGGTINTVAGPGSLVFGATTPPTLPGVVTPSDQTYSTSTPVTVTIHNVPATVYGRALAPGYAGLYQVAIQVPASLANGDWPIVATIGSAALFNVTSSPVGVILTVQN